MTRLRRCALSATRAATVRCTNASFAPPAQAHMVNNRSGPAPDHTGSPMLLAIEQGNTNSLFAIHDGEHWIARWRSATEPSRTADEYAVWLSQLMAMHRLEFGLLNACVIS